MSARRTLAMLEPDTPADAFPPDAAALVEPNGLIAVGGDLAPARLLAAYRRGIFPWYEEGQPILWWTPDPRLVLDPRGLRLSRSLRRILRSGRFRVTLNRNFATVMTACAAPRRNSDGTWITPAMIRAYRQLHAMGHAHSIEVWEGDGLAGGLYGVTLGAAFFGESMFSRESDASKVALAHLCALLAPLEPALIDCQVPSRHLLGLGAEPVPRSLFRERLRLALATAGPAWPAPPSGGAT